MDATLGRKVPASVGALQQSWLGRFLIARGALAIFNFGFDELLYPLVIAILGSIYGGIVMTLASCTVCLIFITVYEKKREKNGEDWLGVDVVENIKKNGEEWAKKLYRRDGILWIFVKIFAAIPTLIFLIALWAFKKGDFLAFFVFSLLRDPFETVIFLRHGRRGKLSKRDWVIFFSATIIGNVYWIVRWTVIIEATKFIWRQVA